MRILQIVARINLKTLAHQCGLIALITKKPSIKTNIRNPENWQSLPYSFTIGQLDKSLIPYYEWREVVRHSSTLPEIQKWNIDHVDSDDPIFNQANSI